MKELSIEDKAKAYDEAIEQLRTMMPNWENLSYNGKTFLQDLMHIFPELKESNDEKVRKEILEFFSQFENGELRGVDISSWIAYLEKQGEKGINGKNREIPFAEQKPAISDNALREGIAHFGITQYQIDNWLKKYVDVEKQGSQILANSAKTCKDEQNPADKIEPKFKVGDIIKATEDGETFTIKKITKDKYIYTDDSFDWIKDQDEYELVEQKPTDEEMKELLHTEYEKGRADAIEEMQKPAWSEEDEEMLNFIIARLHSHPNVNLEEYSKEYNWLNYTLKSLKGRIQPQPKQEWSQNDIDMIDWLIRCCEKEHEELCNDKYGHQDIVSDLKRDCRKKWNWLESLKNKVIPQSHWKPSEEQIDALNEVIRNPYLSTAEYNGLIALREQFKAL